MKNRKKRYIIFLILYLSIYTGLFTLFEIYETYKNGIIGYAIFLVIIICFVYTSITISDKIVNKIIKEEK